MPDFIHALEDCINNTEDAVHKLSGAVQSFQPGVADMPRLSKVLNNRHRCLVLPSTQIQAHQAQISGSIAPQIENLISRAETLVSSQAARVSNLEERLSILQSRHQPASRQADSTASQAGPDPGESVATGGEVEASYLEDVQMKDLSIPQRRKFMALKTRRARLEKEWEAHLRETGRA